MTEVCVPQHTSFHFWISFSSKAFNLDSFRFSSVIVENLFLSLGFLQFAEGVINPIVYVLFVF